MPECWCSWVWWGATAHADGDALGVAGTLLAMDLFRMHMPARQIAESRCVSPVSELGAVLVDFFTCEVVVTTVPCLQKVISIVGMPGLWEAGDALSYLRSHVVPCTTVLCTARPRNEHTEIVFLSLVLRVHVLHLSTDRR